MRRAGILLQRIQIAGRAVRGRQADAGCDPRDRDQPQRHPFSETARGDGDAADRDRAGLQPRRIAGDLGVLPRAWPQPAHGRRALCQCLREPGMQPGRHDLAGRRRCALLRRHQERHGGGRSHPVLRCRGWRKISTIAASRRGNWRRRCAFCRRRGSACSKAAPGCATPRHGNDCARRLAKQIAGLPGIDIDVSGRGQCRVRPHAGGNGSPRCAIGAGSSIPSSAAAPASCSRGTRSRNASTNSRPTSVASQSAPNATSPNGCRADATHPSNRPDEAANRICIGRRFCCSRSPTASQIDRHVLWSINSKLLSIRLAITSSTSRDPC